MVGSRRDWNSENHSDTIAPHELPALLDLLYPNLSRTLSADEGQDSCDVTAVHELTGRSETEIRAALVRLRRSRLHEVLQELERPLFSVERPGTSSRDPLTDVFRERTVTTILDSHRESMLPKAKRPTDLAEERVARWTSGIILVVFGLAFCLLLVGGVLHVTYP